VPVRRSLSTTNFFFGEGGGGVFPHLLFKRRQARGLLEEQDAKTSKSPTKRFFLLNFLPLLIFYFLRKNKNAKSRI